jgi:hypothetical protein
MQPGRVFGLVTSLAVIAVLAVPAGAMAGPILLGPSNPGAEHGSDDWLYGTNGEAWVSFDSTDPATGEYDFAIGNQTAGHENRADWRSHIFPLGPAANGARPITFSFAYKFPDKVNQRENIQVFLRFFDAAGTNFFGQKIFRVGFHTGDSNMAGYRTMTITDILAPRKARTADVWITANIWEPWTSGVGRFDDFSVTTVSRLGRTLLVVLGGSVAVLIIIAIAATKFRRKNSGNGSYYLHRKG